MSCNLLDKVAMILVVIGGLNWGLIGLIKINLVTLILGDLSAVIRIVYILVGLATLYLIIRGWRCFMGGSGSEQ